jgi:hypothetical protein
MTGSSQGTSGIGLSGTSPLAGLSSMGAAPTASMGANPQDPGNLSAMNSQEALSSLVGQFMTMCMGLLSLLTTMLQQQGPMSAQGGSDGATGSNIGSSTGNPGSSVGDPGDSGSALGGSDGSSGGSGVQPTGAMKRLADAGKAAAQNRNSHGMCLAGVSDALDSAGLGGKRLPSAYMKAADLQNDGRFTDITDKVKSSGTSLKNLPPGCVIVWNKGGGSGGFGKHGHISITQGNGMETSDHLQQVSSLGNDFRVFVPKG